MVTKPKEQPSQRGGGNRDGTMARQNPYGSQDTTTSKVQNTLSPMSFLPDRGWRREKQIEDDSGRRTKNDSTEKNPGGRGSQKRKKQVVHEKEIGQVIIESREERRERACKVPPY